MNRVLHRKVVLNSVRSGVGADASNEWTKGQVAGYLLGGAMMIGGVYAGLRGNLLSGGLAIILSPFVGTVAGKYVDGSYMTSPV